MRWTIISILLALCLVFLGPLIVGNNPNIVAKCIYWFCVLGFLTTQVVHFTVWVRRNDL